MQHLNVQKIKKIEQLLKQIIAEEKFDDLLKNHLINYNTYFSYAEHEVRSRIIRNNTFSEYRIFSDPAWDILLELFIADAVESKLSISALGIESGVPSTTVMRWITVLANRGLLFRIDDPSDKRRTWVHITNKGRSLMRQYFAYIHH